MSNIIFDFDGTLADSFEVVVKIFEELTRRGEPLPQTEIERLRGMSPMHIIRELKVRPWWMPVLLARGRARLHSQMGQVRPIPGVLEAVRRLAQDKHSLYIMSSNSVQNIQVFLEKQGLNQKFIRIYGGVGVFGKARVLKKIIHQNQLKQADTFYVGDEVRDIEAAQKVGIKIISVSWGYNNAQVLAEHQPDYLAAAPTELAAILGGNGK